MDLFEWLATWEIAAADRREIEARGRARAEPLADVAGHAAERRGATTYGSAARSSSQAS